MRVGVLGDPSLAERIADAIGDEDGSAVRGDADDLRGCDAVVALGEKAVLDLVRAGVSVPVLPVDAGAGLRSVPADETTAAVGSLLDGDWETEPHPLLSIGVDGETVADALFDATLVTSEPARISEYAVRTADEHVETFRADAVTVATPAGTRGYSRAAGGPVVEPGTGVVSVVPVAPFATHVDDWVLPLPVALSVERNEGAVSLFADDREVRGVRPGERVDLDRGGEMELVQVAERGRFFA